MVFSNEEKQIWANSSVMQELEKIAREDGFPSLPDDAYLPVENKEADETPWEEEAELEELYEKSPEEIEKELNELLLEFEKESADKLVDGLKKLANYLGTEGKLAAAHRVEDALLDIKITIKETANG